MDSHTLDEYLVIVKNDTLSLKRRLHAYQKSTKLLLDLQKQFKILAQNSEIYDIDENNFSKILMSASENLQVFSQDISLSVSKIKQLLELKQQLCGLKDFMENKKDIGILLHKKDGTLQTITDDLKDQMLIGQTSK